MNRQIVLTSKDRAKHPNKTIRRPGYTKEEKRWYWKETTTLNFNQIPVGMHGLVDEKVKNIGGLTFRSTRGARVK
jgi:hypothetical protein